MTTSGASPARSWTWRRAWPRKESGAARAARQARIPALLLLLPFDFGAQLFFLGLELGGELSSEILRLEHGTDLQHAFFAGHRIRATARPFHRLFHGLHLPHPEARD